MVCCFDCFENEIALSTLSQKSATVAENGETKATVAEFGDSRSFLRQCGQAVTNVLCNNCSLLYIDRAMPCSSGKVGPSSTRCTV